eukprot:superscaffoldBa00000806_g7350
MGFAKCKSSYANDQVQGLERLVIHGYYSLEGTGLHHDRKKPQNGGGVGRMLIPSKGVGPVMGAQNGYGGYPTKGVGYGAAAGATNGQGGKPQGYGVQAGPTNGQQMKGNGYSAQAGAYGGQGTKGNGYGAPAAVAPNGNRGHLNGYGAAAGGLGGNGAKPNGQKATAGPSGGNGARPNGQGGTGSKPMKGYGRPPYGAGPSVGMGASRGLGVPQLARNQGTAYGSNGYNGYGTQPMGGYNGGYGNAGFALGPRFGNGGMKGPKQGYGTSAGVPNGQGYAGARAPNGNGAVPNGYGYPNGGATRPAKPGYGGIPNGYGAKPNGYGPTRGGAMRPQPGYGNGAVPNGYGAKPNGYGAAAGAGAPKGYGAKPNGYGGPSRGSKPPSTKGVGAVSPGEGAKSLGNGYGGPAAVPNGQPKVANTGYGMMPNGKGLKGEVLAPEQPSAAPEQEVAITQGVAPAAPEPTSGILVMVTQEKYQKLPPPVPQGKSYKPVPQATPEPLPVLPQGRDPTPAPEPTPEPAFMDPQGKSPKRMEEELRSPRGRALNQPNLVMEQEQVLQTDLGLNPTVTEQEAILPLDTAMDMELALDILMQGNLNNLVMDKELILELDMEMEIPMEGMEMAMVLVYSLTMQVGLGQGVPTADGKSGGGRQIPYNGAPVVPAGLDGMSQFEPQSAGFGPNGKLGSTYGGMGGLPFGGQTLGMGAEKSNTKYGIGGLQFGGNPLSTGNNGAGKYGYGASPYGPAGDGKSSGKYGYGGFPNGGQLLGLGSNGNAGGKYGYGRMPYEAQPVGLSPEAKSAGKYVKGEVPTPAIAAEGEEMAIDRYVVAFPAVPTPGPTLAYPTVPSYLPVESSLMPDVVHGAGAEDLPDPVNTASLTLDSAPATETQAAAQAPEQPDDVPPQQLPRAKNGKYDLNGFFGNSGYQG